MKDLIDAVKKNPASFREIYTNADHEQSRELYLHFCEEMNKAVHQGCICTEERMALLYPIFREINVEQEESRAYWAECDRKDAAKQEVIR